NTYDERSHTGMLEDIVSSINDDILLDILSRLDHNDLDEIATVSEKMNLLSVTSRPRAVKLPAYKLMLNQTSDLEFDFVLQLAEHPNDKFALKMTEYHMNGLFKKYDLAGRVKNYDYDDDGESGRPMKSRLSEAVTARAAQLLIRFDFEGCRFDKIFIDRHFLAYIEKVMSTPSFTSFHLCDGVFDEDFGRRGIERLQKMLLSTKPSRLRLLFQSEVWSFIDEPFLINFANAVPLADLTIFDRENVSQLRPTIKFAQALSTIKTMELPRIIVDTKWILPQIVKRLSLKTKGMWWIGVTGEINQSEIDVLLDQESDLRSFSDPEAPQGYGIAIAESHKVFFSDQADRDHSSLRILFAQFYDSSTDLDSE
ncbi:hypothetical protein PENTCL1PPCAC_3763, partial [Pristionchus entomophagus]